MGTRRRYRKKADQFVVAVRLDLDTNGFTYQKWGAPQRCKPGDWLVDNGGDVYTVDHDVFTRTYRQTGAGRFVKTTPIWAEVASEAGQVQTKEGVSTYRAGDYLVDYLVSNNEDGTDAYCIPAAKFDSMYELDE